MTVLLVLLAVLILLALLPLGVEVLYKGDGLFVRAKAGPIWLKLYPSAPDKEKKKKKKPKKEPEPEPEEAAPDEAEPAKKGGKLELVKAALPLLRPALAGVKRRLTIRDLELLVTWAAANPADTAVGYGYANSALGILWAVVDENFKVKRSRLGCQVDFNITSPTVYAKAVLTMNLWQVLTLALPLLIRFYKNYKAQQAKITKKEA